MDTTKPVLGFAAYSGTGKTTLLEKVIPLLNARGLRLAVIKQTHHDFEIDQPGKDSYRLRQAGAKQMLIASSHRSVLITEQKNRHEPVLAELIAGLDQTALDLILVEGFKQADFPKIELHRAACSSALLYMQDRSIIAIASDESLETGELPLLDINQPQQLSKFICDWLKV